MDVIELFLGVLEGLWTHEKKAAQQRNIEVFLV